MKNSNNPVGQIVLINVNKKHCGNVQQEPLDDNINENEKKDVEILNKTNTFNLKQLNFENVERIIEKNYYHIPKEKLNKSSFDIKERNDGNWTDFLKTSNSSLNHHYENPDLFISKKNASSIYKLNHETIYECSDKPDNLNKQCIVKNEKKNLPEYEKPIFNKNKPKPLARNLDLQIINKKSVKSVNNSFKENTKDNLIKKQLLTDTELNQIELFYRSQRTYVYACKSMANLYFTQTDLINNGRYSSPRVHEWSLSKTGVPIIVFNKGGTRSRLKRQLKLYLAEKGSGFTLFSDVIDNLSDYKKMYENFHTLYLSTDHRKMAGLSFDCSKSADEFLHQIELITSNPKNIALTGPKFIPKKSFMNSKNHLNKCKDKNKKKKKKIKKSEISMPCLFEYITSLSLKDFDNFYSLSTLVTFNYKKEDLIENNFPKLLIENDKEKKENKYETCKTNVNNEKKDFYLNNKPNYKLHKPSSLCSSSYSSPTLSSPNSSCCEEN